MEHKLLEIEMLNLIVGEWIWWFGKGSGGEDVVGKWGVVIRRVS